MKHLIWGAGLAATLALSACQTPGTVPQIGTPAPTETPLQQAAAQRLIDAHNGYQAIAALATAAVQSGRLSRAQLQLLRDTNIKVATLMDESTTVLTTLQRAQKIETLAAALRVRLGL